MSGNEDDAINSINTDSSNQRLMNNQEPEQNKDLEANRAEDKDSVWRDALTYIERLSCI